MPWNGRHGWKWIGAPQSGVLGLFGAQQAPPPHTPDLKLPDEPSNAPIRPLEATPSSDADALLLSLRLVLLGVEIVMALAAGLLSVWCATMTRSVVHAVFRLPALAECAYTAVFAFGLLAFFAQIFQQHSRLLLLKRLGLLWSPPSALVASLVLHSACLVLLSADTSLPTGDTLSLRRVVLAPMEEELSFRALVGHLALHRLRGHALASAAVSSAGFALVHLANARLSPDNKGQLLVQIAWALVVGVFLALRYTRKGSLLECVLLHAINNVFAAVTSTSPLGEPEKSLVGILSIVAYTLASVREWHAMAGPKMR